MAKNIRFEVISMFIIIINGTLSNGDGEETSTKGKNVKYDIRKLFSDEVHRLDGSPLVKSENLTDSFNASDIIKIIPKHVNLGDPIFKNIVESGRYVDKSLFIRVFLKDKFETIVITRPKNFGKTTNLSMLRYFLSINESSSAKLFHKLKISEDDWFCRAHRNQYPVIFVTFKNIQRDNFNDAESAFKRVISDLYKSHFYLMTGNVLNIQEKALFQNIIAQTAPLHIFELGIFRLTEFLRKALGKKSFLLIDDYDTPIVSAVMNDYSDRMMTLLSNLLIFTLNNNCNLEKTVLMGVTLVKGSLFSFVSDLSTHTVFNDDKYSAFFGFTESELEKLLTAEEKQTVLPKIKDHYDGYPWGQTKVYNPRSVISLINGSAADSTKTDKLLQNVVTKAGVSLKMDFLSLVHGKKLEKLIHESLAYEHLTDDEEVFWSLLVHSGYLTAVPTDFTHQKAQLRISNKAMNETFQELLKYFKTARSYPEYCNFLDSFRSGDGASVARLLSTYIKEPGSLFALSTNPKEREYRSFVTDLLDGLQDEFSIKSNSLFGLGEIILIPKDPTQRGIIFEFQRCESEAELVKTAELALRQIISKRYTSALKNHGCKSALFIGIAFFKKKVEIKFKNVRSAPGKA